MFSICFAQRRHQLTEKKTEALAIIFFVLFVWGIAITNNGLFGHGETEYPTLVSTLPFYCK